MCFADKKRVVIKVGSSTLAYPETGSINIRKSRALVEVLADLKNSGKEIVFVSSGAQCVGAAKGGFSEKPRDIPSKQACAAIGQSELMKFYSDMFGQYNHNVAQLLLTRDVIRDRKSTRLNSSH